MNMKIQEHIFNAVLLISLSFSNLMFSMEESEKDIPTSETTFQDIPKELYGILGEQGIISIVNTSNTIPEAVDKVTEFLKTSRLINKAFNSELIQKHIHDHLIKIFKATMAKKFASDLSNLSQKELNDKLKEFRQNIASWEQSGPTSNEKINEAEKLIIAGASPNLVTYLSTSNTGQGIQEHPRTFLLDAIQLKALHPLIPLLLLYGADPNGGRVEYGSFSDMHAQLQSTDNFKVVPWRLLHQAVTFQPSQNVNSGLIIEQLLAYKADINATDKTTGDTALHAAIKYGNVDAVKSLLKHGAKIDIKNINDETPLELAQRFHNFIDEGHMPTYYEIIELLKEQKEKLSTQN